MGKLMYDTSIKYKKFYQRIMASWTDESLDWAQGTAVLLGMPSYSDEGVGYHDPDVENNKMPFLESMLD